MQRYDMILCDSGCVKDLLRLSLTGYSESFQT